jgi:hypothetical protein
MIVRGSGERLGEEEAVAEGRIMVVEVGILLIDDWVLPPAQRVEGVTVQLGMGGDELDTAASVRLSVRVRLSVMEGAAELRVTEEATELDVAKAVVDKPASEVIESVIEAVTIGRTWDDDRRELDPVGRDEATDVEREADALSEVADAVIAEVKASTVRLVVGAVTADEILSTLALVTGPVHADVKSSTVAADEALCVLDVLDWVTEYEFEGMTADPNTDEPASELTLAPEMPSVVLAVGTGGGANTAWPVGMTHTVSVIVTPTTIVVVAVIGRSRSSRSLWFCGDARMRRGKSASKEREMKGYMID